MHLKPISRELRRKLYSRGEASVRVESEVNTIRTSLALHLSYLLLTKMFSCIVDLVHILHQHVNHTTERLVVSDVTALVVETDVAQGAGERSGRY